MEHGKSTGPNKTTKPDKGGKVDKTSAAGKNSKAPDKKVLHFYNYVVDFY